MTYPDAPSGLMAQGIFEAEGKDADNLRQRLASIGMDWFHKCQNQRERQERQWYLNIAFFTGNQYVKFRSTQNGSFDLYTPKAPYYRARIVINQIRRVIRKEVSRLTAQKPNAFVIPASTEDTDVFAAQAGELIWNSLWRRLNFNKVLREAVWWQNVCGNGFIKSYWDATVMDPDSDLPGDIVMEVVSPFHLFFPDMMITDIEKQPYVIQAQVKTNSWVRQNFGIDSTNHKLDDIDSSLLNVLGLNDGNAKKDQTTILEVWVKPGYLPEMPKGGMFTIVADKIVQGVDEWPYEHKEYPFSKLDGITSGKFYTHSIIEDLIPLQMELNRSRSQLIESKNRMSKPQLVAPKGSVDPKRITSEPGQVIEYNVGFDPPQPLALQNLPSYVTEEINRLYTDISDISGQHEVSNGSTPPGVTAATAISFLQEQDESLIAGHYTSIEETVEKCAKHALTYVKMFWDEARTVKIVGIDGSFDVQTFKGTDLRGNADIKVESGSALPTSRAAKQAFIMDLMKMGFIDPQEGLGFLEVGALNKLYERIKVDERQAQRENLKLRVIKEEDLKLHMETWAAENPEAAVDKDSGLALEPPLIVPVNDWDNHEIHIKVHNDYRKSQSFESAPKVTKMLFQEHVMMHEEALSGQMVHPLTGMDASDPNAPDPEEEEMSMDEMDQENQQEDSQEGTTGPVPMPETSDEAPEGMVQ